MSRRFSPEYEQICREALAKGKVLVEGTRAEAANIRSYFYHYRRYVRENKLPLSGEIGNLTFTLVPEGLEIAVKSAPGAKALGAALGKEPKPEFK